MTKHKIDEVLTNRTTEAGVANTYRCYTGYEGSYIILSMEIENTLCIQFCRMAKRHLAIGWGWGTQSSYALLSFHVDI